MGKSFGLNFSLGFALPVKYQQPSGGGVLAQPGEDTDLWRLGKTERRGHLVCAPQPLHFPATVVLISLLNHAASRLPAALRPSNSAIRQSWVLSSVSVN